jgi:hypothetical protein
MITTFKELCKVLEYLYTKVQMYIKLRIARSKESEIDLNIPNRWWKAEEEDNYTSSKAFKF